MNPKIALLAALSLVPAPALAGTVVPGPEAGIGLTAMVLIGAGYTYLRRRSTR